MWRKLSGDECRAGDGNLGRKMKRALAVLKLVSLSVIKFRVLTLSTDKTTTLHIKSEALKLASGESVMAEFDFLPLVPSRVGGMLRESMKT